MEEEGEVEEAFESFVTDAVVAAFFFPPSPSTTALPSWKCGRQVVALTTCVTPLALRVSRQRAEVTPPTKRRREGCTRVSSRGGEEEEEEVKAAGDDDDGTEEETFPVPPPAPAAPPSSVPSLALRAATRAAATTRSASARVPQGPRGGCAGGEASHIRKENKGRGFFFLEVFFKAGLNWKKPSCSLLAPSLVLFLGLGGGVCRKPIAQGKEKSKTAVEGRQCGERRRRRKKRW